MTHAGIPVIDLVMTTRELARLIRLSGLDLDQIQEETHGCADTFKGTAGKLTAVAGGEAEATVRSIYHGKTGKEIVASKLHRFRIHRSYREMTVMIGKGEITMATVSGLANAVNVLEEIRTGKKSVDLLEVMACPDGCANGGGQPIPVNEQILKSRSRAIYDMDNGASIHGAHNNPTVVQIYDEFLKEPGSQLSRQHLYTTFSKRDVLL